MRPGLLEKLWKWFKRKLPWTVKTQSGEDETLAQILHAEIEWHIARNLYISTHGACEMCGAKSKLEVHHVQPYSKCVELRYDQTNLITLCRACHFRFGHGRNWRKSNPKIRELCALTRENLTNVV